MKFDIVSHYSELGKPYEPLFRNMTASARKFCPDAVLTMVTSTPRDWMSEVFDRVIPPPYDFGKENMAIQHGVTMASWMCSTDRPCLFVDPDLEFFAPPTPALEMEADVGVLWRGVKIKPDQPILLCMVAAKPGRPKFWERFGSVNVNLPVHVHQWWGEQFAMNLLTGIDRRAEDIVRVEDANIWLMTGDDHVGNPEDVSTKAWAVHRKGARKGAGWDKVFGGVRNIPRQLGVNLMEVA